MGIEALTNAAHAAGFSMASAEDAVEEIVTEIRETRALVLRDDAAGSGQTGRRYFRWLLPAPAGSTVQG